MRRQPSRWWTIHCPDAECRGDPDGTHHHHGVANDAIEHTPPTGDWAGWVSGALLLRRSAEEGFQAAAYAAGLVHCAAQVAAEGAGHP